MKNVVDYYIQILWVYMVSKSGSIVLVIKEVCVSLKVFEDINKFAIKLKNKFYCGW
jgi:hypothetical protein